MEVSSDPFVGLRRGHYGLILSDPPWNFATFSDKGLGKSPQSHYDCMSLDAIKALPVAELAAPDCALIMWAVSPMLPHALEVMQAWGFKFKSAGAWAKQSSTGASWAFGTGFIYRGAAEHFLVGTRGKPAVRSRSIRNLIVAPLREHSRKPEQMREDAAALFAGPRLEMFARERAPGWDAWGNQAPQLSIRERLAELELELGNLAAAIRERVPT